MSAPRGAVKLVELAVVKLSGRVVPNHQRTSTCQSDPSADVPSRSGPVNVPSASVLGVPSTNPVWLDEGSDVKEGATNCTTIVLLSL